MLKFAQLNQKQRDFVYRVCEGIRRLSDDPAILSVYGDGSASPNGEKFAAVREGASFRCVFDFNIGRCYHTSVQLPVEE